MRKNFTYSNRKRVRHKDADLSAVLRIRITLVRFRIQILLVTLMRIRILSFTLMRIRILASK
jgi:hypothetical protein